MDTVRKKGALVFILGIMKLLYMPFDSLALAQPAKIESLLV
jgi:hypothetical protein